MEKEQPWDINISDLQSYMLWVSQQRAYLDLLNTRVAKTADATYELFFRGVSHSSYKNIPSIFRDDLIYNEDVIFNEAISRNYADFANDKTTFDMLVRMQHYGVPTRLLDVTQDPLVALYFATRKSSKDTSGNEQGKVYAYFVSKNKIRYPDSPEVSLYANLARQKSRDWVQNDTKNGLEKLIQTATRETPVCGEIDDFDLQNVYCVKPRLNNPRIIRQKGAFLLFGQVGTKSFCPQIQTCRNVNEWEILRQQINVICLTPLQNLDKNEDVINLEKDINVTDKDVIECWQKLKKRMIEEPRIIARFFYYDEFKKDILASLKAASKAYLERIHMFGVIPPPKGSSQDNVISTLYGNSIKSALYDIFNESGVIGETSTEVFNKTTISKELENYGINEESLFPELDVLGKSLRKKYEHIDERSADE